jgi:hypothetical protein
MKREFEWDSEKSQAGENDADIKTQTCILNESMI